MISNFLKMIYFNKNLEKTIKLFPAFLIVFSFLSSSSLVAQDFPLSFSLDQISAKVNLSYLSKRVERGSFRGGQTSKLNIRFSTSPSFLSSYSSIYFGVTHIEPNRKLKIKPPFLTTRPIPIVAGSSISGTDLNMLSHFARIDFFDRFADGYSPEPNENPPFHADPAATFTVLPSKTEIDVNTYDDGSQKRLAATPPPELLLGGKELEKNLAEELAGLSPEEIEKKFIELTGGVQQTPSPSVRPRLTPKDKEIFLRNGFIDFSLLNSYLFPEYLRQIDIYLGVQNRMTDILLVDVGWTFSLYPNADKIGVVTAAPYTASIDNSNEFHIIFSSESLKLFPTLFPTLLFAYSPTFDQINLEGSLYYENALSDSLTFYGEAYLGSVEAKGSYLGSSYIDPEASTEKHKTVPNVYVPKAGGVERSEVSYIYYGAKIGLSYIFTKNLVLKLEANWVENDGKSSESGISSQNVLYGLSKSNGVFSKPAGTLNSAAPRSLSNFSVFYNKKCAYSWFDLSLAFSY